MRRVNAQGLLRMLVKYHQEQQFKAFYPSAKEAIEYSICAGCGFLSAEYMKVRAF